MRRSIGFAHRSMGWLRAWFANIFFCG